MAQWVDSNYFLESCNKDTLCQYLYHLLFIKAQQFKLFTDIDQTDDFVLFCVSKLLVRLNNKEEITVKSISNYIKNVIYPWRNEYIQQFCSSESNCIEDFDVTDFADYLVDTTSENDFRSYECDRISIDNIIRRHLKKIPVKIRSCEWSNIYASCLLTLYDRIKTAVVLANKESIDKDSALFNRVVRQLKTKPPILFHIPETMSNYISVLVNELVHAVSADISYTTKSAVSISDCYKSLVTAANNEEGD